MSCSTFVKKKAPGQRFEKTKKVKISDSWNFSFKVMLRNNIWTEQWRTKGRTGKHSQIIFSFLQYLEDFLWEQTIPGSRECWMGNAVKDERVAGCLFCCTKTLEGVIAMNWGVRIEVWGDLSRSGFMKDAGRSLESRQRRGLPQVSISCCSKVV